MRCNKKHTGGNPNEVNVRNNDTDECEKPQADLEFDFDSSLGHEIQKYCLLQY